MNQLSFKTILNIVLFSWVLGSQPTQAQSVVSGNTAFALDLYGQLKSTPGNLFFSPYSVSTALAMTYAGARGNTEKEMAKVFHFGDQRQVSSGFGALQRQLNEVAKQPGIELNVANGLWTQNGHPFLPAFLNIARDKYQANVTQADFKTAAGPVCDEINNWVGGKTKGKIKEILPPGSLNELTRLVLANAIYFKGIWIKQFDKNATLPLPFHVSSTRQVQAPLMNHVDDIRYVEDADLQAVELPYEGGKLSMMILLPTQIEGCEALEAKLSPQWLTGTIDRMRKQKVQILLPRFKLESDFNLDATLSKMGMVNAFRENVADFSGIDGSKLLYISAIFHKAWGEINEQGTEAAAATAVHVATLGYHTSPPPPPVFRADHPFIFIIRDTRSGSLLFIGRLVNPLQ